QFTNAGEAGAEGIPRDRADSDAGDEAGAGADQAASAHEEAAAGGEIAGVRAAEAGGSARGEAPASQAGRCAEGGGEPVYGSAVEGGGGGWGASAVGAHGRFQRRELADSDRECGGAEGADRWLWRSEWPEGRRQAGREAVCGSGWRL